MARRLASTPIVLLLLIAPASARTPSSDVQVEPENVRVGIFYSGQRIRVKASTAASDGVVIRVTGPEGPLVLKKKGKKFGFLWMNVGEIHYQAIPTLYVLRSSRKLEEMATGETLRRLKLGFDALRDGLPAESEYGARELFGELVKLKQRDRLFSCKADGIQIESLGNGRQQATGEVFLPAKTPMGDYTVDVFGFQDGQGELVGTATLHLEPGAVVSSITSLATNHGLLYGCLAVAVAILAGLFTGFIFGR